MILRVTGGRTLPTEIVQQVVVKTDGVPLFVEELTKTVLESGFLREADGAYELTAPLPPLAIPATLHDSLMARLDRLSTVKTVAQLGATIGRAFAYKVLQAVAPLDEATLQQGLRHLVEAELVYQRGLPPQATYMFKHALIQDAAYQSLLRSTRQQYHLRIAQVLEVQFPETAETQPELLAHHYTEAGIGEQAVMYWQRAGERAGEHSASVEAIQHFTQGLAVLKTLARTPECLQQELLLQNALGPILMATRGWSSPEVEATYARARELCEQVGETPQRFPALMGVSTYYLARGQLRQACELREQLLALAQCQQDSNCLPQAHVALGTILFWRGAFSQACSHLEQGLRLSAQAPSSVLGAAGDELEVNSRRVLALALWVLGYPEQALQRIHEAVTWARQLSHAFSLAFALSGVALIHQHRREARATAEQAEAVIAMAHEHEFPRWGALGAILHGWACAEQGQTVEGIAQLRQGAMEWRSQGQELTRPYQLALLAHAHSHIGEVAEGLHVLTEAFALIDSTEESWCEAELYRLKGDLLLAQSVENHAAAHTCFQQALVVARRQQAKSWELRAAPSLASLWQQQGKRIGAYELLAPIYGWFTEGFDTADLQEAKALLEALT